MLRVRGHYAVPPEGTPVNEIDLRKYVNPEFVHAAISNFSAGNSHTKAFKNPRSDIKYLMASHCACTDIEGNKPTIEHLVYSGIAPRENIFLYDAWLSRDQQPEEGKLLLGTGTGAPPAAVAVFSALRRQAGIEGPVEIEMYGFDGTTELLHGVLDEMPSDYLDRDKVAVRSGDDVYANVQEVYLDQMMQLIALQYFYPPFVGRITVDNTHSLSAGIFNTVDGKPNDDYQVIYHEDDGPEPEAPAP